MEQLKKLLRQDDWKNVMQVCIVHCNLGWLTDDGTVVKLRGKFPKRMACLYNYMYIIREDPDATGCNWVASLIILPRQ